MTERREGGSLPRFIAVAIILVALLLGGAFAVQQARHKQVTPAPVTELPGGDQKPAEESPAPPSANTVPSSSAAPQTANHLPQSGPTDSVMAVVVLGLLVGAGVSYVQSRRQLAPL